MAAKTPLIINAAICGSAPLSASEHLPKNPEEIGQQAVEAFEAGASIVHLHARDDNGVPTGDKAYYARAVKVIKDAGADVLVNLTTSFSASNVDDWDKRFEVLELQPDIATFDAGTFNWADHHVFKNTPQFLAELAGRMLKQGVKPEIEVFDYGQIGNALRVAERELMKFPLYYQFVLGVKGASPASSRALDYLREGLPRNSVWSVAGIGQHQLSMTALAIIEGGHARTGLEDNLWMEKGVPATNAKLVRRVAELAKLLGREVATPEQARNILEIG
ncbi:3-keto-5-aminohexanoate cleavage protein [Achromobacter aloeverae]